MGETRWSIFHRATMLEWDVVTGVIPFWYEKISPAVGLLSLFKNVLISPFESVSWYEGRQEEICGVQLSLEPFYSVKMLGKWSFTSPPEPLSESWVEVDLKGEAGLQSEQTWNISVPLKVRERRQRAGVKSFLGWTLLPMKEGHGIPLNPDVSAANTTKVAVVQHFNYCLLLSL